MSVVAATAGGAVEGDLVAGQNHQVTTAITSSAATTAPIAAEVGYQSESTFSRAFQRRFGMRPGEARQSGAAA